MLVHEPLSGLSGIRITVSELCTTTTPVRRSRNPRQQKKFIKRYGYKSVPSMLVITPGVIVMHPEVFARLEAQGAAHKALQTRTPA